MFNQLNPYFVSIDSLTLFPNTKLYEMANAGTFLPVSEKERLIELQVLIKNLQIRTHLLANSKLNYYPFIAFLPKQRKTIINEIQYIIDTTNEVDMEAYRKSLHSL